MGVAFAHTRARSANYRQYHRHLALRARAWETLGPINMVHRAEMHPAVARPDFHGCCVVSAKESREVGGGQIPPQHNTYPLTRLESHATNCDTADNFL